jgi:glycosyltransferase involved in cell wall biosynthesis
MAKQMIAGGTGVEPDRDTDRKLRVLLVAPMPPPDHGGIANWTRIVCKQVRVDPDCELLVLSSAKRRRQHVEASLVMRGISGVVRAVSDIWRFCWKIWEQKPDVVHLCTSGGPATIKDLFILAISRLLQVPVVLHYHMGRLPDIMAQAGEDWNLTCTAMALAAATVVLDKRSEGLLKAALPRQRIVRLPNPVEIDVLDELRAPIAPPRLGAECAKLVYLGHAMRTKGLRELVEACAKLPRGTLTLEIVGPVVVTFKRKLCRIAEAADGGEWLHFCGPVEHDEAVLHIHHADLLVLPSYSEGMPNVVLEAMACGKAVLATTVGALPEMLDIGGPQECGVCVLARSADELLAAIKYLLSDNQRRRELGERGRRRAESLYAAPTACRQLVDLWKTVHDNHTLPAPVVDEAPPETLKVLLATPMPPPEHGGIVNWTRVVCKTLASHPEIQLRVVDTKRRYRGIPRMRLLSRLVFGTPQALMDSYRIYRQLKTNRPDVLHINTSGSLGTPRDVLVLSIAKRLGVPSIIHYHLQNPPAEITHQRFYWKMTRWAMSLADVVVLLDSLSGACVRAAIPRKRIVVLPNMVELDVIERLMMARTTPIASGAALTIMFVGFVAPKKGVRDLVEAWLRLSNRNVRLELVGTVVDSRLQKTLGRRASQGGKGDGLQFLGAMNHEQVLQRLLTADMFVLPSHGESAPMVVLEAMGCGKAVVSTFTGAIPEMLDIGGPQQCGICVPPRDVDALVAAMDQLLENGELRKEYGRRGRERVVAKYSVPIGCSQLLELWRSVIPTATPHSEVPSDA